MFIFKVFDKIKYFKNKELKTPNKPIHYYIIYDLDRIRMAILIENIKALFARDGDGMF